MSCLFCKIISGEIPSTKVHEDETVFAFADIHPAAPTHILVVPKKHIASLAEAAPKDSELLGKLMSAAQALAEQRQLARGYRLVVNTGDEGGQTVDHLHIHLLGGRPMHWPPG